MLEEGSFRGRTADFFWMLFLGVVSMVVSINLFGLHGFGGALMLWRMKGVSETLREKRSQRAEKKRRK